MIAYGLLVTVAAWFSLWCVGEATARLLFGRHAALVTAATRLPLGLAATLCLLEAFGYFLPIRLSVWFVVLPAVFGAVTLARAPRRRLLRRDRALAATSFAALSVGLLPVLAAGRFTAAALTNNDGTYYITTAEWLRDVAYRREYPSWDAVPTAQCMTERVLHLWQWRTGTPNLMAAVSALSGLPSTASLAVATALLFGCVPCAAIGVARALGAARGEARELAVGMVTACSAATAFLGFQHMTGHLGVASLFPAACGAAIACAREGGWRRVLHAALLFAASVALFADGAAVLVVIALVAVLAGHRRFARAVAWTSAVALATVVVAPFTVLRAGRAAWNTLRYRVPSQRIIFPQRGWLPRSVLDDLASLTGVDPWPPWPAAWPPNVQTFVEWLGALCGAALFAAGVVKLRRSRGEASGAVLVGALLLACTALLRVHYLQGKVLLTGALFVLPLCGIGAAALVGTWRGGVLVLLFAAAELDALFQLGRPSAFKVVDTPAHDALVRELAKVPRGSLLALDGLGAPSDVVQDEHRAERAALLDGLIPMQPGLDGGFYTPVCFDVKRPSRLPEVAYALQRTTSEVLTRGQTLAAWAQFRVVETDLSRGGFIAAWAPTHGFLAAERDADGTVFRWAEWTSQGTLHVISRALCARLRGETRVVRGAGAVAIQVAGESAFAGNAFAEWSPFETASFSLLEPVVVSFAMTRASLSPPDDAHALAMRKLALEPLDRCGTFRRADGQPDPVTLPLTLNEPLELVVLPPIGAACYQIALGVEADVPSPLRLTIDGGAPSWRYVKRGIATLETDVLPSSAERRITVAKSVAPGSIRLTTVEAVPRPCERGDRGPLTSP